MKIDFVYALDDSGQVQLFTKGHIGPPAAFVDVCKNFYNKHFGKNADISKADVKWTYWRNVKAPGDNIISDRQLVESEEGPGAFMVTVIDKYLPM